MLGSLLTACLKTVFTSSSHCFPVVLVLASRLPLAVLLPVQIKNQQSDEESLISGLWTLRIKQLVVLTSSSSFHQDLFYYLTLLAWLFFLQCISVWIFRLVDKLAGVGWQTVSLQISGPLEFSPVVNPALVLLLSTVLFWDDNSLIFRLKMKTKSSLSSNWVRCFIHRVSASRNLLGVRADADSEYKQISTNRQTVCCDDPSDVVVHRNVTEGGDLFTDIKLLERHSQIFKVILTFFYSFEATKSVVLIRTMMFF